MNLRSGTVVGAHILRPEHRPAFEEGVRQLFLRWTALCLAVENQWGGQSSAQKADSLLQEVIQWFYSRKEHYADELEEVLDDAILHDFNVEAEDGSPRQVADALVKIYGECFQGNYSSVEKMQEQTASGVAKSRRQVVDLDGTVMCEDSGGDSSSDGEDGDDDDDAMDTGGPSAPPAPAVNREAIVDEDGFTLVQTGRRGRR